MAPAYTLVPSFLMMFLAIFFTESRANNTIRFIITSACQTGIKKSIFKDVTVKDLRTACSEDYLYNVLDQMMWGWTRCSLQVCVITASKLMKAYVFIHNGSLDISAGQSVGSSSESQSDSSISP